MEFLKKQKNKQTNQIKIRENIDFINKNYYNKKEDIITNMVKTYSMYYEINEGKHVSREKWKMNK